MPVPLSLNSTATNSLPLFIAACSAGTLRMEMRNVPPFGMASRALTAILTMASSSSARSTFTGQTLGSLFSS